MVQKLGIDQHVETDRSVFLFPPDQRAADFIAYTDNLKIEIAGKVEMRADFDVCSIERNLADETTHRVAGAEMMADERDLTGSVDHIFFIHLVLWNGTLCLDIYIECHDNLPIVSSRP